METEYQTPFYKQIWFLGGVAALAVFALCFFAIDYPVQTFLRLVFLRRGHGDQQ